ncbi:MAG TPA: trigger factor [Candidatus Pullichristensenella stercorigallinarum]|uniref:Trigger factor n=1 Tax=Candidatus Pullichristensenella stercorigallinarum TaxID=2840909 RepID=A0A9D0ZLV0_9FIRM|nr:trigger factor [Candidatus Pullichristensenella stercorigallinarum]
MATTYEKLSSNKVKLGFVVESEKFDEGIRKAYIKNVKRFNISGFRRGKAPMKIIENYYGPGVFYEDAFDIIFPDIYRAALEEHDVKPVDRPELEVEQIEKGKELKFTVEVFVRPDVELGEYKHLGIEKKVEEVTDDDVMADIERARDRAARYIEVTDREAKLDDQANIDYQGLLDGTPFEGGTAQGHELVLGSGAFIPGFEDQVVGMKIGEEKDINVTFPENYHAEELAGKPVVFKVKLNSLREKEMPALDDEFVKDVSETANTVDEYKKEIREKLEKQAEERADAAFESEIIETVSDNAKIDIPKAMVEEQIDNMLRDMELRMMYQGLRMEDFLKYSGQTMEQMRETYRQQAEDRVKTQLTLEAITKAEGIEPTDEEIDKELERFAEQGKKTLEEFKKDMPEGDMEYFKEVATINKTLKFLKDNAAKE